MSKGSTLMSFGFGSYKGVDEIPEKIVALFTSMLDRPDKPVEYTEEIINAGLENRIDFTRTFNISAYEYIVKNNSKMNTEKERSKKVFIDFSSNESERETSLRNGGITIDSVSASAIEDLTDGFEEVLDNSELQYAIETIKSLNEDFIIDYGVNLVSVIKKAVIGFPQAVAKLKELCQEFDVVSEQVQIILQSGRDIESCFA